jgi:two-component system sensor histidine kinase/response regulator
MIGQTPRLWGGAMTPDFYKDFWKKLCELHPFSGEVTNIRKNGVAYTAIAHISPILSSKGSLIGYIGTEEDISERLSLEEKMRQNITELKKINRLMIGRELKMIELKQQIKKLQDSTH